MGFKPFPVFGRVLRRGFGQAGDGGSHITPMQSRILVTQPANLIGYWPLGDLTGTVADDISTTNADGAYAGTFTLNQSGIGDGSKSVSFGGGRVSLAANLATFDTPFDGAVGTLFCWVKVSSASIWTEVNFRRIFSIGVDANNLIQVARASDNQLNYIYTAGGTANNQVFTTSGPITFFSVALTWNKVANQVKNYFNGVQVGATLTGLGVWAGALASTFSALADINSAGTGNSWSGNLAHMAAWKIALTAAEISRIGVLSAS